MLITQDEKRSHEASGLRTFFNEQMALLHTLVENLGATHQEDGQVDAYAQIVENFVDAANGKMRAVHNYADKLRGHVRALYEHVLQISDQIPPPVELNQDAFRRNAFVNALFVSRHDIDRLFKANRSVGEYLQNHSEARVPVVYGLLTACMNERSIFGVGMLGDLLVREVAQRSVNFSSHKLHTLCASDAELSVELRHYLFNRVVMLIKQDMASRVAAQTYRPGDKSYESRVNGLANPDVYLNALLEAISSPAGLLRIEKTHFRLSKLGIKLENNDGQLANEFDVHELTWADSSKNVLLQIAYSRC